MWTPKVSVPTHSENPALWLASSSHPPFPSRALGPLQVEGVLVRFRLPTKASSARPPRGTCWTRAGRTLDAPRGPTSHRAAHPAPEGFGSSEDSDLEREEDLLWFRVLLAKKRLTRFFRDLEQKNGSPFALSPP